MKYRGEMFLMRTHVQFGAEDVVSPSGRPFTGVLRGAAPTITFSFGGFGWRLS
ncbi:hypothetical protein BN970_03546 [Mycolicibacterium conceptionense]|uniref:Uncharacterized protein n=1 Tax=Mycolicibacterium conceptionense TaxID=451644 RepID=A0A0U1DJ23_9MYCO|nr:hypothetical protein BN970_03546 [Mycolicibacterium conceptionense]